METPLEFGTIPFGSTETLLLTISNDRVPGTITIGTKINGPSYKILTNSQNTCLAGISAGQNCTLPVEFDPVAVGNHDDFLTLTPTGGAAPSTVSLHGNCRLDQRLNASKGPLAERAFFLSAHSVP